MTEPKTKTLGTIKTDKLGKVAAYKDYAKATESFQAARKAQQEAKAKLKEHLAVKLSVEEKEAFDFVQEGSTLRVFINLVPKKQRASASNHPDLSDKV